MVEPINIKILVDNKVTEGLAAEHGFSLWIEAAGRRILFDTGQGSALVNNASKLNVSLDTTEIIILSHGHYDHTGGIPYVLEQAPNAQVYCHPEVKSYRYSIRDGKSKPIHIPHLARSAIEHMPPQRIHWIKQPLEICPGIGLTGSIPRLTDYENTGGSFYLDSDGKKIDPIEDDIALWMQTSQGVVVIVGCSHAGLINTLNYIRRLSNTFKICAVLGGFHLLEANLLRIHRTIHDLIDIDPELIVPCHCTGEKPMKKLEQVFGNRVSIGHAGATYTFSGSGEPMGF